MQLSTSNGKCVLMMEQSHELPNLERYIVNPTEDLDAEYKGWLDLRVAHAKANLAKAVIALANYGGGVIVLGFDELPSGLLARPKPAALPNVTQDDVNAAVQRYADPQLHCRLYSVKHPTIGSIHPVIRVPGSDVPVISKRDQSDAGLRQLKVYVRRPGPKSEEPQSVDEWRKLLDRCVWARREEILNSIRGIVLGRVEESSSDPTATELEGFMDSSRENWMALAQDTPKDAPHRFPNGYYEFGIAPGNPQAAISLSELKDRLAVAQRVKTSGWPPFLDIGVEGENPYPSEGCIQAWLGNPSPNKVFNDPPHSDFWRASSSGQLYIIRGYGEDGPEWAKSLQHDPGTTLALDIAVIRIWEYLRFASHFFKTFMDVEEVVIRCQYAGLSGRALIRNSEFAFSFRRRVIQVNEVLLTGQFKIQQLEDNMPEVLQHLMAPLFEYFDFFSLTVAHVQNIIDRYRQSWPW